ncbi:MAG: bifunctional adenosylcobinamide kinase/adenosylcobinamide-phosphate guanylyltransferase, partial [Acidimicrobiales bacterium]
LSPASLAADAELSARVQTHRSRRPAGWQTVEAVGGDLPVAVVTAVGSVLIDALGPWVAGSPAFAPDVSLLCAALQERAGDAVVVSEEVGLGVHPSTAAGRSFRDALGEVNQAVAAIADEVLLVVAGRTLRLDPQSR